MSVSQRLEYLRGELRAERISYGELAELQGLADHIDPSDVELREAAGLPEHDDERPSKVFRLSLRADNEAFADEPRGELARILRKIADHVETDGEIEFYQTIFDVNGNDVGRFAFKDADYWREQA